MRALGYKKRIIAAILAAMMFVCSGCNGDIQISTGLAKNEIFKISGNTEDISEMLLVLSNEKNKYETSFGTDIWSRTFDDVSLENEVKDTVKNQVVEMYVIYLMAKEDGVTLSEEEEEILSQAASQYMESLTDEEKEVLSLKENTVLRLYEKMYLTDKYFNLKTSEDIPEISDEDARVMDFMYIFLKTGDRDVRGNVSSYDDEAKAAIRQTADEVLEKVNAGSDFLALIQQYSDSDEYETKTGRGTFDTAVDAAAFALSDGANSGIIETKEGYYIVKCVNDYLETETQENKKVLEKQYKVDKFQEIYNPFLKKQTMEFNNSVWDNVNIADYEKCTSTGLYEVYDQYSSQLDWQMEK